MSLFGNKIEAFQNVHPGGCYNLSMAACSSSDEAKMLFYSYHCGKNQQKIRQVAKLRGFNVAAMQKQSLLQQELQRIFFNVQQKHSIHGVIFYFYALFILLSLHFLVIYNIFYCSVLNRFLMIFCWTSYSLAIFHLRHHFGGNLFVKNSRLFRLYLDAFDHIFAIPVKEWIYIHNVSHHLYTNSLLDRTLIDPLPFLRQNNNYKEFQGKSKRYYYKFQWIYGLVLFSVHGFRFPFMNILKTKSIKKEWQYDNFNTTKPHWMYMVIYVFILIVAPTYFNGIYALKAYFISCFGAFLVTAILLQVSHNNDDVKHYNNVDDAIKDYDVDKWIKTQIEESMSWGGYLATLVFGGINFHIEHHIAPAVLPIYYYFAAEQVQSLCNRHNIKYIHYNGFLTAFYKYQKYVFRINR